MNLKSLKRKKYIPILFKSSKNSLQLPDSKHKRNIKSILISKILVNQLKKIVMGLENNSLEIQSLKDTVFNLESNICQLDQDKMRLAIRLLETEDYMFSSNKSIFDLLENFNFSNIEINLIIEEIEEYRYY